MNIFRSKVLAAGLVALAACGGGRDAGSDNTLRVGATPVPHAEILEQVKPILAKQGIELEVVTFTDYVQPNLALAADELDANYFQTIPYMESFNRDRGADLTTVARVHVEPMGLYSRKHRALADLPNGASIAVPSDPTNTGRALLLLQTAGLLKLRANAGIDASVLDVAENPRNLKFSELESAQLPRALPDVDAAVINTNFALEAGLNPTRDALAIEGANSPYVNVLAVRAGRTQDARVQALSRALSGPEVRKFIEERYKGAVVPGPAR